jgi:hypothetical protein
MINYDVDTDPRRLIYFVLAFVSIVGAPLLVRLLSTFLPKRLEKLAFLQQLGLVTEGDGREESAQRPRRRWWFGG